MSWGERSCKHLYDGCNQEPTILTCNVNCPGYDPNGREPDSKPLMVSDITSPEDKSEKARLSSANYSANSRTESPFNTI
jgi:hypothetical protein